MFSLVVVFSSVSTVSPFSALFSFFCLSLTWVHKPNKEGKYSGYAHSNNKQNCRSYSECLIVVYQAVSWQSALFL